MSGPIGSPKLYIDWDSTRRVFTNRLEAALGEVVPAMRDALGQIVPRTSETPEPAAKPEGEQTPPREPPPAAGGG